ncbi:uncharacterized protein [Pyrus communis]|uniref:uncharacterized protein n=1 Tax=Pyrus communis TaxID=23211 RepID=UPI0035C1D0FE
MDLLQQTRVENPSSGEGSIPKAMGRNKARRLKEKSKENDEYAAPHEVAASLRLIAEQTALEKREAAQSTRGFQIHYITEEEKQAAIAEYYAWEEQFSHLEEGSQLVLVVPDEKNIDKPVLDSVTDQLNTTPTSEEKSCCTGDHKQTDDKEKGPLCRICREGHHGLEYCPWRERVPMDATEVGKGFEITCHLCGSLDNKCKHNWSHAVEVFCRICNVEGDHSELECPKLPERAKDEARVEAKKAKKKAAKARARARAKALKDGQ